MSLFGKFTKKENTTSPSSVLPTIIETLNKAGYKSQRQTESCVGYDDDGLYCNFCYLENDPEFLRGGERSVHNDTSAQYPLNR
ncbi:hypothetical protein HMPREF3185_01003 [Porphyromonas somerae]|uniref:Uncharacterized protein n=1 Tax=Porphyromonas somerae TaxID=322095 RepID=A0A134B8R1_9PORP|nr:hypothetical protein HMPREF3184_01003 [Porphyromonadaceae bacterium KA00676]KXB76333.1 hypothetical protein HMPREF3185_01003 [Porphyromonas somerae]